MTSTATAAGSAASVFRYSIVTLFIAGALSVLVFHQGTVTILHLMGYANPPFSFAPTKPLSVPQIWSWVFWGGVWGIVYGAAEKYFPRGPMYWVAAFVFGAIAPVLVVAFIVFPLRGQPIAWGWNPTRIVVSMIIHGMWGLGTGLFLHWRPGAAAR
jgi:hypothetical protein